MKVWFVVIFVFLSSSVYSQKYFSGDGDYSILINENVTVKHVEITGGGFIDSYILRESGSFAYMVSIAKVKPTSLTSETVYTEEYRQSYLKECGCKILKQQKIVTENFKGIRFAIEAELNGSRVKGLSVSTVSSGFLFTINFVTEESKFTSHMGEYEKLIRSARFK